LLVSGRVSTKITFCKKTQKVVSTHLKRPTLPPWGFHPSNTPNVSPVSLSVAAAWISLEVGDLPAVGVSFAAANLESAGILPSNLSFPASILCDF